MRYKALLVSAVLASIMLVGCGSSSDKDGTSNDKAVGDTNSAGAPKSPAAKGGAGLGTAPTPATGPTTTK
jgi:hypothetical protein